MLGGARFQKYIPVQYGKHLLGVLGREAMLTLEWVDSRRHQTRGRFFHRTVVVFECLRLSYKALPIDLWLLEAFQSELGSLLLLFSSLQIADIYLNRGADLNFALY